MRKLMWFALGFGAACALCVYCWITEGLILFAVLLLALSVGFFLSGRRWKKLRILAVLCLGVSVGLGWFQIYAAQYLRLASDSDGRIGTVTAQCTDYGVQTGYGTAVEGLVLLDGKPFRVMFYVNGEAEIAPGDLLKGTFQFSVTTPGGSGASAYYPGKGIFLRAYQRSDVQLAKLTGTPWLYRPAVMRRQLAGILDRCFPADAAGFAKALLLGDRSGIDYETNTAFKVSGISHIIAVSGLHVAILFTLVHNLCLRRRWLTALVGIPTMIFFAAVAGFSPSVTRACLMTVLMMLAMLLEREYDGPTELAFSCMAMLTVNPLVITSVSFQLSVGCIAGIFLFQKKIAAWLSKALYSGRKRGWKRLSDWLAGSVATTLSAMSLTTPVVAYYFGTVSLVGILTNLLTLWVVSLIFYGVMLVCLLGWLWPAAGTAAAAAVAWPVRYVLWISKGLARFPLAAVYTRSIYIVAWLVFVYVLLGVFLVSKVRRPKVLLCCVLLGLCLSLTASWAEGLTDDCRMTVLNVGQGQCIILQSDGKTYLVDCGGSDDADAADLAAETLLSQGISRLDGLILTHFDRDHAGGAAYLLSRIPADMLFVPDCADEEGVAEALERRITGTVFRVKENLMLTYSGTSLTIFGPVLTNSSNESSLAVLFQKENCDILITGDRGAFGERMLLKTAAIPELEVLVVGHHGSQGSTCAELLEAVKPKIAVISVGKNNYGHPSQAVLERLYAMGCAVYRTDQDGNIVFRR